METPEALNLIIFDEEEYLPAEYLQKANEFRTSINEDLAQCVAALEA
ncbi:MAG: hypothetical protein LUQ47_05035 [Methanotrichaceae archaeon]|nr:hypothetical protein [Methanotrichaceae archaeon]